MVPADLPAILRIRVRDWTLPKSRCPDSSPILQTARALPYSARQRVSIQGQSLGSQDSEDGHQAWPWLDILLSWDHQGEPGSPCPPPPCI